MALRLVRDIETREARVPGAMELARLAANGDSTATASLLRMLAPEMARVVRGVMGPHSSDVDDALQQSLVGLVHALRAFRGECPPVGYACRIAFRTALALRKRVHRSRVHRDSSLDLAGLETPLETGALSEANRRTDLVRSLLEEIPQEQAEALAMRTMLGWSLEEIVEASGAPLNTVRSRLRLAKEALRRKIEADPALADELGVEL